MKSLKTKLVLIMVIVTVASLCAVSFVSYNTAANLMEQELIQSATNNAEHSAQTVNQWLEGIVNEANALAASNDVISLDPEQYMASLNKVIEKHQDYSLIYVANSTGSSLGTSNTPFSVADRDYFIKAMQGQTVISDPVMGKSTGKMVVVIATPVYRDGSKTPAGIVGISVTLEYLQNLMTGMKFGESGYGLIQHPNMTTIAHPDEEYLGNSQIIETAGADLKNIFERMAAGEKGYGYYFDGIDKFMAFAPVTSTGWSVAQVANMEETMAPLINIKNLSIMINSIVILIIIVITIIIASNIAKPLIFLSSVADSVARGDLTGRIELGGRRDEIGFLASSFEKMVANLKNMINEIKNNSARLSSHSQELASASEEVSATVEEVAGTTNEIAASSAQGAENAAKAVQETKLMREVAEQGNQAVAQTVQKINSIATASQNIARAVNSLGEQSNQIGEIINTITDIADQTNLLALNAAIEAARAGEYGRGFAVVAEEVRKLAEQSADASGKITSLIKDIQVGVGEAVEALEYGTREVNEGVEIANNAGAALKQIIDAVRDNTLLIQEVAQGSIQANEGTQHLSASNEQISSTVQQVTGTAYDLAKIAEELQNSVVRFKVDD